MAPTPLVVWISQRYGRTARPAIQEVQQRIGELTADAEENISGVRVVKSFAREPQQLDRFRHSVARVFDQSMVATRLEATFNPVIGFLPQLGLAAVLLIGGGPRDPWASDDRPVHAVLPVLEPADRADALTWRDARPRPARDGVGGGASFRCSTVSRGSSAPADAPPLPPGNGHVQLQDVTLRYDEADEFGAVHAGPRGISLDGGPRRAGPRATCSATSRWTSPPGAPSPWSAPPASGKTSPPLLPL